MTAQRRVSDGVTPGPAGQAYLESLAAFGMRPGLERVSALLARLGRPQDAYRVIHVVGTNGKSSTTRYCEALLRAHGLRSGAYLSPHISGWTERVLVDGRPVGERAVRGAASSACAREVRGLPAELGETTQFEVLTVAALLAFAESGVEAVALEAGLGGRLDATNVVKAPVVVLTNIALEHTEVLGDTRELIFAEKAAVIKGGDAVFGALDGLEDEARRVCAAAGATPHFLRDSRAAGRPRRARLARRLRGDVRSRRRAAGALGRPARAHAGPVPGAATRRWPWPPCACCSAASTRPPPGRRWPPPPCPAACRWSRERPLVLADGAHNPDGVRVLAQSLAGRRASRGPAVGVLAIMRDKDYEAMLARLPAAARPRRLHAGERAAQPHGRGAGAALRAAAARVGRAAPPVHGRGRRRPARRARAARARSRAPAGSVLVGGSLYLLEDLRDVLAGGP